MDILITYKINRWFVLKFKRTISGNWDLSPSQLIAVAKLYQQEIAQEDFIAAFFNIPRIIARRLDPFFCYSLFEKIDFIYEFKPKDTFIIPEISCGVPPEPKLNKLSFGQFMYIDTYFNDFAATDEDPALNKFIACLYWPKGEKFDENLISKRADMAAKINPVTKQAIAINYRLVKDWLVDKYPQIFSKKINVDKSPAKRNNNSSWLPIFESIVDDDITNSDKYADQSLHKILRYITRKIKQNAKRP